MNKEVKEKLQELQIFKERDGNARAQLIKLINISRDLVSVNDAAELGLPIEDLVNQIVNGPPDKPKEKGNELKRMREPFEVAQTQLPDLKKNKSDQLESQQTDQPQQGTLQQAEPSVQRFWEKLQIVDVNNGVIQLPNEVYFLGNGQKRSSLYIRECYVELKDQIFKDFELYQAHTLSTKPIKSAYVITGNPGIGKSLFIYYLMWIVSKTKGTIVSYSIHAYREIYYVYTYNNGIPVVYVSDSVGNILPYLDDKNTYYFVDSLQAKNYPAKTIIVSSPDPDKYKEFLKNYGTTRRYLPPWDKSELDTVKALLYPDVSQIKLDELWIKWGGIPRFVLENADDNEFQSAIEKVIPTLDLDLCFKSIGQEDPQAPGSHKVIQIVPVDKPGLVKYSQMELRFSSKVMSRTVVQQVEANEQDKITRSLAVPTFLHSPLGGSFFESVVHRKLKQGGTFKRRHLESNVESQVIIPKPPSSVSIKKVNSIASSPTGDYLLPIYTNFPVVDSLIKPNQLFQVTVSSTHPPLMQELSNIVDQLGNPPNVDLYFIVPEDQYDGFQHQKYLTTTKKVATNLSIQVKTITQYVLLFPLASDQ